MIRLTALALLAALSAAPLSTEARAAGGCDHISNPFEFNKCLAAQSPKRGQTRATAPQAERSGGIRSVRRGGRVSSTIYLGGAPVERARGGRKRIVFDLRR